MATKKEIAPVLIACVTIDEDSAIFVLKNKSKKTGKEILAEYQNSSTTDLFNDWAITKGYCEEHSESEIEIVTDGE